MASFTIGFILEQALGHVTYADNLRRQAHHAAHIQPQWALIPFAPTGIGAHIPLYKSNWTVRAGLLARREVARMARNGRLDALFFHTQVPAILSTSWMRRIPSVISLDATPLQYDALGAFYQHPQGNAQIERLKRRMNQACYEAARHIVVWSDWVKQSLINDYAMPAAKITVLPPGVHVADWAPAAPKRTTPGPVKILFVGGDLERKGGLLLLEAFRALRHLGVELHLVTRAQVAPEPGLTVYNAMQPNSPELRALYHACDIFALPTYGDTLALVLSEAAAAGLTLVATPVGGIPELVRDGETGLSVPVGDGAALTAALRTLVEQPKLRRRLAEQGHTAIRRNHDAGVNAARLLDLLADVAAQQQTQLKVAS